MKTEIVRIGIGLGILLVATGAYAEKKAMAIMAGI